jgi:rSAM/selenodomain-associated transferase 1
MNQERRILGVFAKWPKPGSVKTRLAAETSADYAAMVARACWLDTMALAKSLSAAHWLAYAPADAGPAFAEEAVGWSLVPQSAGDLGERMRSFFADRFAEGADEVVLIGTDSPNLPAAYLEQAFTALERVDVVLGPAFDGGYYLIGLSRPAPDLFGPGIAWSTATVLGATVDRLGGRSLALLPPWYDIDTLADWRALHGHAAALRAAGEPIGLEQVLAVPPFGV